MRPERIEEITSNFKDLSIAVYGDFAIDVYWFLDPCGSEISVETGLMAEGVQVQKYYLGGAANIVSNLSYLEPAMIYAVGIIGDDIYSREILRQMSFLNVNTDYLITSKEFATPVFIKRIIDGKEINRIDLGFLNKRTVNIQKELISRINHSLKKSDAFIFNQQIPNTIQDNYFIEECNKIFETNKEKTILVDSRNLGGLFKDVSLKINENEALKIIENKTGLKHPQDKKYTDLEFLKSGAKKINEHNKRPLFITMGDRGIMAYDGNDFIMTPGIQIFDDTDTVGAGDTITSSLILCLSSGIGIQEAIEFANIAASITIRKQFTTGYVTIEEMVDAAKDTVYILNQELAEDVRKAEYLDDTEIEICYPDIKLPVETIKYMIFDNDGTISTLRYGWEEVMEDVMVRSVLGSHYGQVDIDMFNDIKAKVKEYINNSTGIQTILQMEALVDMVKKFSIVSKKNVLDKFSYKKQYLNELMKVVEKRIQKLQSGELCVNDFLVAGSEKLLERFKDQGMSLYLASGTDLEYVINECSILNYRDFFTGNIYGALDDINKFSKKKLITEIINNNGLRGEELCVIGDGPVEIREARRVGALAIGVASDERKRFGLNQKKRERLIKAGAHFIIPDFSQQEKFFKYIFNC